MLLTCSNTHKGLHNSCSVLDYFFLKDYYGIYLVKWINTEVFFNCNVNIFTVSNTILYSLRIELETYFFFNIPYLTILNTLKCQKTHFLIRTLLFMPFFPYDLPPGGAFMSNSFHDNMVNNGARDLLFILNIPYLTIFKHTGSVKNTFSHQNITFYAFFSIRPPTRGSCFNFFRHISYIHGRLSVVKDTRKQV